jgi:hypothetical protein
MEDRKAMTSVLDVQDLTVSYNGGHALEVMLPNVRLWIGAFQ